MFTKPDTKPENPKGLKKFSRAANKTNETTTRLETKTVREATQPNAYTKSGV